MSSTNATTAVVHNGKEGRQVDEQQELLNEALNLQNQVARTMLDLVKEGAQRILATLHHAAGKIELGMEIALADFRDAAVTEVLDSIQARREALESKKAASRSKAVKDQCDKQLALLEQREQAVLVKLGGAGDGSKAITHKDQTVDG